MADNDFMDAMMDPPSLGDTPSFWAGGSFQDPRTSFSLMGRDRLGNLGMFGGTVASYFMPGAQNLWDIKRAGGLGNAARANYQYSTMQHAAGYMEAQIRHNMIARMTEAAPGFGDLSQADQDMMLGMAHSNPAFMRQLSPGTLTDQGYQSAYRAAATFENAYQPSAAEVNRNIRSMQDVFYTGGRENYGRTMGLGQNTLMAITAEGIRRGALKPLSFEDARKRQTGLFEKGGLTKELEAANVTTGDVTKLLEESRGSLSTFESKMGSKYKLESGAIAAYIEKIQKTTGVAGLDVSSLKAQGVAEGSQDYVQAFKAFQDVGYQGGPEMLFGALEKMTKDATLDPARMKAIAQKMGQITDMTGKTLDEIVTLMEVINKGPGGKLSVERTAAITHMAATVGLGIPGVTAEERSRMQAAVMDTASTVTRSQQGQLAEYFTRSGLAGHAAIGKQLLDTTPEGQEKAAQLMARLMMNPSGEGITDAATLGVLGAVRVQDTESVAFVNRQQERINNRDLVEYNRLRKVSPTGKDTTALLESLRTRGYEIDAKTGEAKPSDLTYQMTMAAAARTTGNLAGGSKTWAADIRAVGGALGGKTDEQKMRMGAAFITASAGGVKDVSLDLLGDIAKRQGITGPLTLEKIRDAGALVGQLRGDRANMADITGAATVIATPLLPDLAKQKVAEERKNRTAALNRVGDALSASGVFDKLLGTQDAAGAMAKAMGIDVASGAGLVASSIATLDQDKRNQVQKYAMDWMKLQSKIEDPENVADDKDALRKEQTELRTKAWGIARGGGSAVTDTGMQEFFQGLTKGGPEALFMAAKTQADQERKFVFEFKGKVEGLKEQSVNQVDPPASDGTPKNTNKP